MLGYVYDSGACELGIGAKWAEWGLELFFFPLQKEKCVRTKIEHRLNTLHSLIKVIIPMCLINIQNVIDIIINTMKTQWKCCMKCGQYSVV